MDAINDFFTAFSSFLWGWPMIILLLECHRRCFTVQSTGNSIGSYNWYR